MRSRLKPADSLGRFRRTKVRTIFESPWFELSEETFVDTSEPGQRQHYTVHRPDGVIVVALTADQRLVLVQQVRPAICALTVELPCGAIENGESPETAALRELREETGYAGGAATYATSCYISPDRVDATDHVVCVTGATPAGDPAEGHALTVSAVELKAMIVGGTFKHFAGLGALLAASAAGRLPGFAAFCRAIL